MQQTSAMPHAGFYAIQRRQQQYGSVNNKQLLHNAQVGEHIDTIENHLTLTLTCFARCIARCFARCILTMHTDDGSDHVDRSPGRQSPCNHQ
jgi:hypothetical protein